MTCVQRRAPHVQRHKVACLGAGALLIEALRRLVCAREEQLAAKHLDCAAHRKVAPVVVRRLVAPRAALALWPYADLIRLHAIREQ